MLNFLYRLEEKGWVKRRKAGSRNVYTPTVTRRAYGVFSMRQRLDTLFGGDLRQAVRALEARADARPASWVKPSACWNKKQVETEEYELYDPYG